MKAVEKFVQKASTYLLAIGGGSVDDGTKFVSAAGVSLQKIQLIYLDAV